MLNKSTRDQIKEKLKAKVPSPEQPAAGDDDDVEYFPTPVKPDEPDVWYDTMRMKYVIRTTSDEWIDFNEVSVKRMLAKQGYRSRQGKKENISPLNERLYEIQTEQNVHLAIPLAGYSKGKHDIGALRVFVTGQRKILEPKKGQCPLIRDFVHGLLGDNGAHFWGWLAMAYKSLQAGPPFRPGQTIALTGESHCGKSVCQKIVTMVLGGRAAKPYSTMIGKSDFNSELLKAEHLVVEDECPSSDIRSRRIFGSMLKQLVANEGQRCHPKGCEPTFLLPFWRVTVSLNDEPENLMVLPPFDNSIADKLFLFKCRRYRFPFKKDDERGYAKWIAKIEAEIPALLWDLLEYKVPDEVRDVRYGIKAYHDPEILAALRELQPENQLLEWIDGILFGTLLMKEWVGTASELKALLADRGDKAEVNRVLYYPSVCGTYLKRLMTQYAKRIKKVKTNGQPRWRILKGGL